ncbi:hypothetical protein OAD62_00085 [Oceanihabitans sp.]|nr:hypothetical protein [Oceanihabitans sp.]
MKYETIKEFTKTTKTSRSSIYRFYTHNPDLFKKTKIENRKRVIPITHQKYFDIEIMHDEYNVLCSENKSMKNLIDGLMDKNSLCRTLWEMDWTYFITVAYKAERNRKSCYRMMDSLYEHLVSSFPEVTIRLFFTTEKFTNRDGHHNHLVLHIGKEYADWIVQETIRSLFNYDRTDIVYYDPYKAGLFYIAKDGLVNEDWDLFGSDLNGTKQVS